MELFLYYDEGVYFGVQYVIFVMNVYEYQGIGLVQVCVGELFRFMGNVMLQDWLFWCFVFEIGDFF